jgi:hypothetical protein
MQEQPLDSPKQWLHLIEYVIDLRQCLLQLVHGMFLLDIMQSALNVEDLQFDHMQQFLALIREDVLLLPLFLLYTFLLYHRILYFPISEVPRP